MRVLPLTLLGTALAGNPVAQVIKLLTNLEARVQYNGEVETKQYQEFAEWCEDTSREKSYEIEQGQALSADLGATIEQADGQIANKQSEISEIAQVVAANDQDLKAAGSIRQKEHEDFVANEKDLVDTVDTLIRAQSVLAKELRNKSLVQMPKVMNELTTAFSALLNASIFSTQDKSKLKAFMQKDDDDDVPFGNPTVVAYESHSGGILETLASMQEKAEGMLAEARKTEMNAKHNFELLDQSLKQELAVQNKALGAAKKSLGASKQVRAQAAGDKVVTEKDLAEDQAYVQDMTQNCKMRVQDAETSAASRAEELKAIGEAKRIIQEMTGAASEREYSLLQRGQVAPTFDQVAQRIASIGKKDGSFLMTQLAQQIRTATAMSEDPFGKVKRLIEQMITRLMKEAAEEADQKAFCDKELAENTAKRDDRSAIVDTLSTRVEKATAQVAKLKQETASLQSELAELAKSQKELTTLRNKEHDEYVGAKKDYQEGLEGLRNALQVLRAYYAKNDAAFVQQPDVGVHEKSSDQATGVISLLEVSESDFARSLAEMQTNEDQAQQVYDKTTQDNRVSKATKDSDVKYKTQEAARIEATVADAKSDRSGVQEELDAVMEYLEKLRPQCTTVPTTYAERKARREQEIEGLKSALEILETETVFTQQPADTFLALRSVHRH